jgi:hypothetical protein
MTIFLFFPEFYVLWNGVFSFTTGGIWLLLITAPLLGRGTTGSFTLIHCHSLNLAILATAGWSDKSLLVLVGTVTLGFRSSKTLDHILLTCLPAKLLQVLASTVIFGSESSYWQLQQLAWLTVKLLHCQSVANGSWPSLYSLSTDRTENIASNSSSIVTCVCCGHYLATVVVYRATI